MTKLIIAIDGPVGSGKSTVARTVARMLGYAYLDSGAMYRAVAWKALRWGVLLDSPASLVVLAENMRIDLTQEGGALRVSVDGDRRYRGHSLSRGRARRFASRRGARGAQRCWWTSSAARARAAAW